MTLPLVLLNRRRIGGFNPRAIIAGSTAMVWLDPSDLTTMFQDSAGTTPVTAAGQPVGLVLDKSQGLVLGPELVTNGDFSSGTTGWSAIGGGSIAAVSGEIQVTGGGSFSGARQSVNVTAGRSYLVTFSARRGTTTQNLSVAFGTGSVTITASSVTAQTFLVSAASSPLNLNLTIANAAASGTAFFDNISVRELPGFHATQSTAASRPTYGVVPSRGRVNLLTYSEQFDNAAWVKASASVSANIGVAPDGTATADTITSSGAAGYIFPGATSIFAAAGGSTFTYSVYAKAGTATSIQLLVAATATYSGTFNLSTGVASTVSANTTVSMIALPDGWYRCVITCASVANTVYTELQIGRVASGLTFQLWGAQLETGSTASPYQRVVSQFDVTDPAGFPSYPLHYLSFDGVDDFLVTPTITPNADKVQVFAGVRKLSDAATAMLLEHSTNLNVNSGTFYLTAPTTAGGGIPASFVSKGSLPAGGSGSNVSSFPANVAGVLTGLGDIAGDVSSIRLNGTQVNGNIDQGTGNYLAYPMYIGRRGGTSLPANMQLFQLITRFSTANLDAGLVSQTERFVGQKTGIVI